MVYLDDLNRLRDSESKVRAIMYRHLHAVWAKLDPDKPEATRDALLEIMPVLVNKYGDMASVVAMEWYQGVRGQVAGLPRYTPIKAKPIPSEQICETTRWAVGGLWQDDSETVLSLLETSADRWVRNQSRQTILNAIKRDPAKPRWAFVPRGVKTCAFCTIKASRGWVYKSYKKAAKSHAGCDCEIAPSFEDDVKGVVMSGYDPERYKTLYEQGLAEAEDPRDIKSVAQAMRRVNPDAFSDGIYPESSKRKGSDGTLPKGKYEVFLQEARKRLPANAPFHFKLPPRTVPRVPDGWPADFPILTDKVWSHILYGESKKGKFAGGHLSGHGWLTGGTEFSQNWKPEDILSALRNGLRDIDNRNLNIGANKIYINIHNRQYLIIVSKKSSGQLSISTFFPVS